MRSAVFAVLLTLAAASGAAAAPLEAYGQLPSLDQVTLSPDGSKLAYIVETSDRTNKFVVVQPAGGGGALGGIKAGDAKVRAIEWIDEAHLMVIISQTAHARDVLGPRQEFSEALVLDIAASKQSNLMQSMDNGMNVVEGIPEVRMVDGHAMVFAQGISFAEQRGREALFRIDPSTMRMRLLDAHSANADNWLIDAGGNVVAEEEYGDFASRWRLRARRGTDWQDIYSEDIAIETPDIEGFSADGADIVLRTGSAGDIVVKTFSVTDGHAVPVPAQYDGTGSPMIDRLTGRVLGYRHLRHDVEYVFLDPKNEAAWARVVALFPREQVDFISASDDMSKIVAQVTGISHGDVYFLVDGTTGAHTLIGPAYNKIDTADMNPVSAVLYPAADGRQIDAYLTLPHGRDPHGLPLIVLPHGGPAARDEPGFDWWSQGLASLGYAVLQPQFRGSSGFGWGLLSAGFGEWGRKMQTDLSDGVRALARTGVIDPKRVCIVGASYGGYAALAGPTLDPGVYRCAVSVSGISDLRKFIVWREGRTNEEHLQDRYWLRFAGASSPDDPVLDAISPIKHLDKVTIPMLLIHGHDDTVVPMEQSEDMADALKRAGKNVTFVPLDGEDHWLSRSATRQAMLKATADFLQTNNPP